MTRPAITGFWHEGEWLELRNPDGLATWRQLRWLNAHGCLELVWPGQAEPVKSGQAAWAVGNAHQELAAADERQGTQP